MAGQACVTLLMGVVRQYYGFRGALWQLVGCLAVGTALARTVETFDTQTQVLASSPLVEESPRPVPRSNSQSRIRRAGRMFGARMLEVFSHNKVQGRTLRV